MNDSSFIEKILDEIDKETLSIFLGAGMSVGAGYPTWEELLKKPASDMHLDINKEHDLLRLAQYYQNTNKRTGINTLISEHFVDKEPTVNHHLLANLPIDTYWTTNYDTLLEKALDGAKKEKIVIHKDEQLSSSFYKKNVVKIFKMHGCRTDHTNVVISKSDYEKYGIGSRRLFINHLEATITTQTMLFLGFSFSDPNFLDIIGRITSILEENNKDHYCIMKKVTESDYQKDGTIDTETCKYESIKQKLQIEELKRYNINVLLVNNYNNITKILFKLVTKIKRKKIFISGSAHEYIQFHDANKSQYFIKKLSAELIKNKFHIISGFGLGIGSYIIDGVSDALGYDGSSCKQISNYLTIMPFPSSIYSNNDQEQNKKFTFNYRTEMIKQAGISIFIFGNKKDSDGELVDANGMREEFKISLRNFSLPLPISQTGYISSALNEELTPEKINNMYEQNYKNYKDEDFIKNDQETYNIELEKLNNIKDISDIDGFVNKIIDTLKELI